MFPGSAMSLFPANDIPELVTSHRELINNRCHFLVIDSTSGPTAIAGKVPSGPGLSCWGFFSILFVKEVLSTSAASRRSSLPASGLAGRHQTDFFICTDPVGVLRFSPSYSSSPYPHSLSHTHQLPQRGGWRFRCGCSAPPPSLLPTDSQPLQVSTGALQIPTWERSSGAKPVASSHVVLIIISCDLVFCWKPPPGTSSSAHKMTYWNNN